MKPYTLLLTALLLTSGIKSQVLTGKSAENLIEGCQTVRLDERTKSVSYLKLKNDYPVSAIDHKSWLIKALSLGDKYSLLLIKQEPDKLGYVHYRYQVMYDTYPVEGYVYTIHIQNNKVISANGDFSKATHLSVSKVLTLKDAFQKAIQYFGAEKYKWEDEINATAPEGNLVILPENGTYKLVYKFDIYAVKPLKREFVYVDAADGKILKTINRIETTNVTGTAVTKYNGTRQITTDSYAGSYRLREYGNRGQGIETYDLNNGSSTSSAVDFTDADNYWNTTTSQDDAAYDAHFGAEATYDYFYTNFSRNSIDDSGFMLKSYVHYNYNYVNAFWDGQVMTYGDGDGTSYTALTALEVVAHEITHGLTQFTANLYYSSESGALNESFSDIFGVAIDFYANPTTANWLMGDRISTTGSAFRSMSNPNQFQNPDTYLGQHWDPYEEVHCNSGVQNYWYYLLSTGGSGVNDNGNSFNVTGIGMDKAANIAFRNLTVYLTPYSTYADARFYAIQAAIDLYGACSAEVIATTDAWYAVGVGSVFSDAVLANFTIPQSYYCITPATVNFTSTSVNSTGFLWDFGDGTTSTLNNPSHTYSTAGTYSVQLISTGSASCGGTTDTMMKTNFFTISNTGGPATASCSPTTISSSAQYGITNFTFNTINKSSSGSADGYKDYTCSNSTTVSEGSLYAFSVTNESTYNSSLKIWLDLNNDGLLNNTNELLYGNPNSLQYTSGNLIIPAGIVFNVPLRLRVATDLSGNYLATSCTNSQYGQYEDYSVIMQQNTAAPAADFVASSTTVNLGQTVTFTDLSLNVPTAWQWTFSGGTPSSSNAQNPSVIYNTLGTYNVKLKVTNSDGTDSIIKTAYIHVVNSFNMCSTTTTTTSQNGLLYDSGGPTGNYMNYENCNFLINITCASSITLSCSLFQTQSGYDFFRVYDGANSSGTMLLSSSGSSIPSSVVAYSGKMFIQFTSSSSTTYQGFAASWSSVVPSGTPPVGNFSLSNTNPPLNSPVLFTDQSTNVPVGWNWNFGDGGASILQNPSHSFASPGTYNVTLIVRNCFSSDTVSTSVLVQGAPSITVAPSAINTTITGCNDSTIVPLTITNNGSGALVYNATTGNTGSSGANILFDDFEDGNYNGWTLGSNHTATVTTTAPANGSKCLSLSGGGTQFTGLNRSIANATPSYIGMYVKQTSTSCANMLNVGDANTQSNNGIIYMYFYNSNIYIYNGSTLVNTPYVINQWYHLEFKNINYTTKKFDVYINSSLYLANLSFYSNASTYISKVYLSNYYSGTSYYDDISIGAIPTNSWITAIPDSGMVSPGSSSVVNIKLNAQGLLAGTYTSLITVNNNDPVYPAVIVPCTFTLTGAPSISLSDTCLNYGSIMQNTSKSDTLQIRNTGCDTLHITSISPSLAVFTCYGTTINIAPNDSAAVIVTFNPNAVGAVSGSLHIYNDDVDKTICLNGNSFGAPHVMFDPGSYNITITSCDDSVTVPLTIYNTGLGPLTWAYQQPITSVADDFDPVIDNTLWQTIVGGTAASTCGSISSPNSLYFNGGSREVITKPINTSSGGNIGFYLKISSGSAPCEMADGGEDVILSYSNNNGSTWTNIQTFFTGSYNTFTQLNIVIPVAARTAATLFKWSQPSNSGPGYDNWSIDNVVIASSSSGDFFTVLTNSGTVNAGDSVTVYVKFSSHNLNSGVYTDSITFNTNDPQNLHPGIPCTLTVVGSPDLALSKTCLNYGTVFQYSQNLDTFLIFNHGCSALTVSNIVSSSGAFTVSSTSATIAPNDTGLIVVTFTPPTVGTFTENLYIYNNDNDTLICLNGIALSAPVIAVSPPSFDVTLNACGSSTTLPLNISNTGGSNLNYTIAGGGSSGTIEVLAFTNGVDYDQEYYNTIAAINQYNPGYNLTEINTTSPSALQTALTGKHVLLIGEQEEQTNPGIFTSFATVLQTFVNNGGTVIFCGVASNNSTCIFNTGLFSGSYVNYASGSALNVTNTTHPLTTGVPSSITSPNATMYCNFTNSDKVRLVNYNSTNDVVSYRLLGSGKVIYIGFDFYAYDNNCARIIANAIQWGGESAMASWISLSSASGTATPGNTQTINVTFNSDGLPGGTYTSNITINSNDPVNPEFIVPCTLHVLFNPCVGFGYSSSSCNGNVTFIDSTLNTPTSWLWNFDDGSTSISQNPTHTYTSTGIFDVELIVCNAYGCDTLIRTVQVLSLSGPVAMACAPATTGNCCGMGILNVTFNTINNTTGDGSQGYQNYSCSQSTNLITGQTYTLSVQTGSGYGENVGGWIDYNNNGLFETTEKVITSTNSYSHAASVSIPASAVVNTPLRMRIGSDYYSNMAPGSCTNVTYGQFEDYTIVIQPDTQPPIANFTLNVLDNCQGIVQFLNQSLNNPTSVLWNFGDGSGSTSLNPYHAYANPGNYLVTLTATNPFGTDTYTFTASINSITANFTADSILYEGSMVYFNTVSSGATSFDWDFGDGTSASVQNPIHVYTSTGTYTVTLVASNSFGCSTTSIQSIFIDIPLAITNISKVDEIAIYPNPNNGNFTIEMISTKEDIVYYKILNDLGEVLEKNEIHRTQGKFSKNLNLKKLAPGMYYIHFMDKAGSKILKLLIN